MEDFSNLESMIDGTHKTGEGRDFVEHSTTGAPFRHLIWVQSGDKMLERTWANLFRESAVADLSRWVRPAA